MTEPTSRTDEEPVVANGEPSEGGPATSTPELEALRLRAETAERQRDEYLALVKSTRAEFENYQKRAKRDEAERQRYAHFEIALGLLAVLDNLERATAAAKKASETGPLVQGVAMVEGQLRDLLRRHGVTPIEALGQPFDPNLHQALMQQPTRDKPPNTVVNVLEQG